MLRWPWRMSGVSTGRRPTRQEVPSHMDLDGRISALEAWRGESDARQRRTEARVMEMQLEARRAAESIQNKLDAIHALLQPKVEL